MQAWGRDVEVLAALGHGRSYGVRSRVAFRALPGILETGLWAELASRPPAATRALVTDVGNDIPAGFSAAQILMWVEEALDRLGRFTPDVVLTDIPIATIRALSNAKFLTFRSIHFPSCRLSLAQVCDTAEQVSAGLARLASDRRARFVPLDPDWYGFDPIHVRPSQWRRAWQEILGAPGDLSTEARLGEGLRLYFMRPERRWLFGVEQVARQSGVELRSGGRVWLY